MPTERDQDREMAAWCRSVCLALPSATSDLPFGPGAEALRIHNKMFALLMHVPGVSPHPLMNLKADPDELPLLVKTHALVLPGYHMNKRHWISVVLEPRLDRELVEELIEDSYDNVVLGLPSRLRPVSHRPTGDRPPARRINP
jgi:predicted DNA-binding protein (MmcQ/YjbR family)